MLSLMEAKGMIKRTKTLIRSDYKTEHAKEKLTQHLFKIAEESIKKRAIKKQFKDVVQLKEKCHPKTDYE